MTAKELFDAAKLAAAIEQLNQEIKANPRDTRNRVFLFELLCFSGDFPRAERQLETISQLSGDVNVEIGSQVYKHLLDAEKSRARLFKTDGQPKFLGKAPSYTSLHLEAISHLRENRPAEVEKLMEQSENARTTVKGTIDGKPFNVFRDGDDLLAPFLEAFVQKDYIWLAFENIKTIEITPPKRLRDLIWISAKIQMHDGPLGDLFIPALYHSSSEHPDDRVRLGRMTDWKTIGEGTLVGAGQRIFLVDDTEHPILETRNIEFALTS
jgi:type VI secretion system protein ImpE